MSIPLRQPSLRESVAATINTVALGLLAITVVGIVMISFYPWDPITRLAVDVVNHPTQGEPIHVVIDYCKERDWTPRRMRWALVNDVTVILPDMTVSLPMGCHRTLLLLPVAPHVAPGTYRLQEQVDYEPWPWVGFSYVRQSPPFVIRPRPDPPAED